MILETLPVGPLAANCHVVGCPDTREGFVIDPGGDAPVIIEAIERLEILVRYILNTHGHVDHVAANDAVRDATGASLYIHEGDREMIECPDPDWAAMVGGWDASVPDATFGEGDILTVGSLQVQVLHTPGHSPGCVCLSVGGDLFTGDTLFASGIGRSDLPGGNWETLQASLRRLMAEIDPAMRVHPGHGPSSTMGEEIRVNPWLAELR